MPHPPATSTGRQDTTLTFPAGDNVADRIIIRDSVCVSRRSIKPIAVYELPGR
jgi:hypothetical protein